VNKRLFCEHYIVNPVITEAVDFGVRVEAASKLAKDITGDDVNRLLLRYVMVPTV